MNRCVHGVSPAKGPTSRFTSVAGTRASLPRLVSAPLSPNAKTRIYMDGIFAEFQVKLNPLNPIKNEMNAIARFRHSKVHGKAEV